MENLKYDFLRREFNIKDKAIELSEKALIDVEEEFKYYDEVREYNQLKVLDAFRKERVSDSMFNHSTGYGYGDYGRDALDKVYARIFKTESALVRPHFVNGTHALASVLFGILRPNDTLLTVTGRPYDTLHNIIGINGKSGIGNLKDLGVNYKEVSLKDGKPDIESIKEALLDKSIKLVHIQRSTGYGWRNSLTISEIEQLVLEIRKVNKDVKIFCDNCYGEFVETKEPTEVGVDIVAGSLIKNIGGSIAPTGGYVAGKSDLVELASFRLTTPGIGGECGSTFGVTRLNFQGLFLAPHITMEAVKGAVYAARLLELAGYEVKPNFKDKRTDIIQAIKFNDKDKLINFVKGIQYGAPVDSFVDCEPWDMPGYDDQVIMAAGAFVQGASIELSCDAPIREPYIAYLQGGITFDHAKTGYLIALSNIL